MFYIKLMKYEYFKTLENVGRGSNTQLGGYRNEYQIMHRFDIETTIRMQTNLARHIPLVSRSPAN